MDGRITTGGIHVILHCFKLKFLANRPDIVHVLLMFDVYILNS